MSSVSNPSKILAKISMPRQNTNDKILIKSRRHVVGIILVKLKRGQNLIWSKYLKKLLSIYHLHLSPAYTTPPHLHNNNTTFTDTQHHHIHRNQTPPPPTVTLLHPTPTPPHRQDRLPHHHCHTANLPHHHSSSLSFFLSLWNKSIRLYSFKLV